MQESKSAVSASRKNNGPAYNEELRLKPLKAEDFFSQEQFAEANEWDAKRIAEAAKTLRSSLDIYDPKNPNVPLLVAQMATFNYKSIVNDQNGRFQVIDGGLDELTEYALVRVLRFNAGQLSRLPEISGLGELTRRIARKYGTMIEIRD